MAEVVRKKKRSRSSGRVDREDIKTVLKSVMRRLNARKHRQKCYRHRPVHSSDYLGSDQASNSDDVVSDDLSSGGDELTEPAHDAHSRANTGCTGATANSLPEAVNITSILGEDEIPEKCFSGPILEELVSRYEKVLLGGMKEETRVELIKKYPPPENMKAIVPPKINAEVKVAIQENAIQRDKDCPKYKNGLPRGEENLGYIATSNDGLRLLCDGFHHESVSRRELLLLNVNKDLKETLSRATTTKGRRVIVLIQLIVAKTATREDAHIRVENVLEFLTFHFHRAATYGTLNSYRSAISQIAGPDLGQDFRVKRFFKGVFGKRPPKARYENIWDLQIVLTLVKTLKTETLPLKTLSKKLAVLLALATGQRLQTISLIRVSNISIQYQRILIRISDRIKTSSINRSQPTLNLPFFVDEPQVCVASTLVRYLNVTKGSRDSSDRLFITFKKPRRKASTSTISRWTKDILERSGLDMSIFKPQSTRHASTSSAARAGVSFETIRLAAGWSHNSKTFVNFYNRPSVDNNQFAKDLRRMQMTLASLTSTVRDQHQRIQNQSPPRNQASVDTRRHYINSWKDLGGYNLSFAPGGLLHPMNILKKLERLLNEAGIPEGGKLNLALGCMRGSAAEWAEIKEDSFRSFVDFVEVFKNRYWEVDEQRSLFYEIKYAKFESGTRLAKLLSEKINEEDLISYISQHFSNEPEIRKGIVTQNLDTLEQVEIFLRKLDVLDSSETNNRGRGRNWDRGGERSNERG
nr:unnamed protein product [Callosobruchus chinensis]